MCVSDTQSIKSVVNAFANSHCLRYAPVGESIVIFAQFSQFLEEWKNMQPKAHYIVLPHIFVVRILNTESLGSMYRNHQLLRTVPLIPNCTIPSIPDISSWLSLEPLVTTIRVCRGAGSRRHEAVVVV